MKAQKQTIESYKQEFSRLGYNRSQLISLSKDMDKVASGSKAESVKKRAQALKLLI